MGNLLYWRHYTPSTPYTASVNITISPLYVQFHRRMREALICLVNTACKLQSLDNGDDDEDDDDSGGTGVPASGIIIMVSML